MTTHSWRYGAVIGGACAGIVLFLVLLGGSSGEVASKSNLPDPINLESNMLSERTIIDSTVSDDGVVVYQYVGEKVPEKLAPDEDVSLRTKYSFTRLLGSEGEGDDRVKKFEARTFPQEVFHQDAEGRWFYVEHATTSFQVWNTRPTSFIDAMKRILLPVAHAITFYGLSGDGTIVGVANDGDNNNSTCRISAWSAAQISGSAQNGLSTLDVATSMVVESNETPPPSFLCTATIGRSFLPFQTDFLPARSHISSASLYVYILDVVNTEDDGNDFLTIWETSQNTHTTLVNADYTDFVGELIDSAERKDLTSVSVGQYLSFALNGVGLQAVKKLGQASTCSATTGITCLGLREGHDAVNDRPLDGNSVQVASSEASGISQDPYLSITYTVPDTLGVKGTRLEVKGGRVLLK